MALGLKTYKSTILRDTLYKGGPLYHSQHDLKFDTVEFEKNRSLLTSSSVVEPPPILGLIVLRPDDDVSPLSLRMRTVGSLGDSEETHKASS